MAEIQRLGFAAHELRDQLQTAQLSLDTLKSSGDPSRECPGQLLERALVNLSKLIERTLSDVGWRPVWRVAKPLNSHRFFRKWR